MAKYDRGKLGINDELEPETPKGIERAVPSELDVIKNIYKERPKARSVKLNKRRK